MAKLRVLMLCGYTQNAFIFKGRMGAIRKALEDTADLVFIDPPHTVLLPTNTADFSNYDNPSRSNRAEETPRAWWNYNSESQPPTFEKLDETLVYLRKVIEEQGPFDGVWGFSQGGALAGMVVALMERPELEPIFAAEGPNWPPKPLKFGIVSCGFYPRDLRVQKWFEPALKTPVLHVIGRHDTIVGIERSLPYVDRFENARLEYHGGGHFTPSRAAWRRFFKEYLLQFTEAGCGASDVDALNSPEPTASM